MDEAAAARVLLLRAYESTDFAPWTDADRAWASRAALQAVGPQAPVTAFLAARAELGLRRLTPHDPLLSRWQALRTWRTDWLLAVGVLGLLVGLAADHIGGTHRINLLAPPVWVLVAWNLAVYLWLLAHALLASPRPGRLRGAVAALLRRARQRWLLRHAGASIPAWTAFAADWARASLPLNGARVALALHLGAAALALGVLAGMYLRGLVLDYRVGWESTFLDADAVHTALSVLLAPALALSGISLPDAAGLQALRVQPGVPGSGPAAPWIHLYALQLVLLVVLPRLGLALWAGWRAGRLRRELPLPLDEPYFQRLRLQQHRRHVALQVWPHGQAPSAATQAVLGQLFARAFGDDVRVQMEPALSYGAEDEVPAPSPQGVLRVALFDLGATPEPEIQGRLLRRLAAHGEPPALALVDEAAFAQRFGADSPRLPERRRAWSEVAAAAGSSAVFVDLQAGKLAAAEAALQAALPAMP